MSVFFKIADDGKCVYVAKTLLSNEMKEEEFNKKAVRLTVDEFLSKFPKNISEKLEESINRVKKINEMKLSVFGSDMFSNPVTRTTSTFYRVGGKTFVEDVGEHEEQHEFEEAIKYGKEFYGEEFMKENLDKLVSTRGEAYYAGTRLIEKEEYTKLLGQKEKLTKIVCVQKELKKSPKK